MNQSNTIRPEDLETLGISSQEIQEAGGLEAIAHIVWFLQKTEYYTDTDIDNAISQAIEKKKQEDILNKAFDDFDNDFDNDFKSACDEKSDNDNGLDTEKNTNKIPKSLSIFTSKPVIEHEKSTIKEICNYYCDNKSHPALKLLLDAYFLEVQYIIPDDSDIKEVLKTISLLRAYIAGAKLPNDAEDEQLIVYARDMYKEFLASKHDYDNCPMTFLLDNCSDALPEKYRMTVQSMPIAGILKIFADNCFYDSDTQTIDEPLPEEINIKNLCDMIEMLARIFKIWQ